MSDHHLQSSENSCHWGYFDASLDPVMSIESGDRVTIDTVSGGPEVVPDPEHFSIPPELREIHNKLDCFGPHILTGPIYVQGAKSGSVLEVQIEEIGLRQDWGYNLIIPEKGTLPEEFNELRRVNIPLDLERNVAQMSWGLDLPLAPFFGVMGVAPQPELGQVTSIVPRSCGGNIDNKELISGTSLYLPVYNEGALFSCGDGHGLQGDGEVCITAIETALRGVFRFVARDDMHLDRPYAVTQSHYITMGVDPDLNQCAVLALRDMIGLLVDLAGLSRNDAYMLCSIAGDLRVTQTVNGSKGVHMMMEKRLFET